MKTVSLCAAIFYTCIASCVNASETSPRPSPEDILKRLDALEAQNSELRREIEDLRRPKRSVAVRPSVGDGTITSMAKMQSASPSKSSPLSVRGVPFEAARASLEDAHVWTGAYVGGHAGYSSGKASGANLLTDSVSIDQNVQGSLVGLQVGANYQMGRVVVGLEASGSWDSVNGKSSCLGLQDNNFSQNVFGGFGGVIDNLNPSNKCRVKQDWSVQFLGRLGLASGDGRFFTYAVGGIAITDLRARMQTTAQLPAVTAFGSPLTVNGSSTLGISPWGSSNVHQGAVLGAGTLYALDSRLSVGVEYLYTIYDMKEHGSVSTFTRVFGIGPGDQVTTGTTSGFYSTPLSLSSHTARLVMNYKID